MDLPTDFRFTPSYEQLCVLRDRMKLATESLTGSPIKDRFKIDNALAVLTGFPDMHQMVAAAKKKSNDDKAVIRSVDRRALEFRYVNLALEFDVEPDEATEVFQNAVVSCFELAVEFQRASYKFPHAIDALERLEKATPVMVLLDEWNSLIQDYPNDNVDQMRIRTELFSTFCDHYFDTVSVDVMDEFKVWLRDWIDWQYSRDALVNMSIRTFMNVQTGSVDTYDGWWYETETGARVNAVDRGEVVPVVKRNGIWVANNA